MGVEPVAEKFRSFGFDAGVVDPHDHDQLLGALRRRSELPQALILPTIPGRGVPSFEVHQKVHYIRAPDEVWAAAQEELEAAAGH
jgi:transketolase